MIVRFRPLQKGLRGDEMGVLAGCSVDRAFFCGHVHLIYPQFCAGLTCQPHKISFKKILCVRSRGGERVEIRQTRGSNALGLDISPTSTATPALFDHGGRCCFIRGKALSAMATRPQVFRPVRVIKARAQARQESDQRRREVSPWRHWYGRKVWRMIRQQQLAMEPLCTMCADDDIETMATVCDHVVPHRGDWDVFIQGPFQSLCKHCHDSKKQREERMSR